MHSDELIQQIEQTLRRYKQLEEEANRPYVSMFERWREDGRRYRALQFKYGKDWFDLLAEGCLTVVVLIGLAVTGLVVLLLFWL